MKGEGDDAPSRPRRLPRFAETDLTCDALLGGNAWISQPKTGFRATADAVFLAAAAAAGPGERVLDVGCGAGAALVCLAARLPGLDLHGLELHPGYADLARRNAPGATVWEGDVFAPPAGLRAAGFDLVMTNPPFFAVGGAASPDPGRDLARREARGAVDWVAACLRRVRSGGRIAVVHLAERLPEILAGMAGAGDVAVLPLLPRAGRPAARIVVTARKGARGPFRLAAPLVLHDGPAHGSDADDYTAAARAVLRGGDALVF